MIYIGKISNLKPGKYFNDNTFFFNQKDNRFYIVKPMSGSHFCFRPDEDISIFFEKETLNQITSMMNKFKALVIYL